MEYGKVAYKGKTYQLTEQATLTDRVFPGWFGDVADGEEYTSEWSCRAKDAEGNDYRVYWQFDAVKGQEPEDDGEWPWDDDSHITKIEEA